MAISTNKGSERRNHYRVLYPEKEHPVIIIKEIPFDILDISETGVRFKLKDNKKLPGDLFHAHVILHDGKDVDVLGRIIRMTGEDTLSDHSF